MDAIRRARRSRRGAEIVEFVLTLPVFLMILGGAMDFGWLYFQKSLLDTAVSTGCRTASLIDPGENDNYMDNLHQEGVQAIKDSLAEGGSACEDCTVHVQVVGEIPGRSVVCTVTRPYHPLFGIIPSMVVESTIAVRFEWQR